MTTFSHQIERYTKRILPMTVEHALNDFYNEHGYGEELRPGGELWVHDAFLDDTLDGPLAVTDYSTALFW